MEQENERVANNLREVKQHLEDFINKNAIGTTLYLAGYRRLEGRADAIKVLCQELANEIDSEIEFLD